MVVFIPAIDGQSGNSKKTARIVITSTSKTLTPSFIAGITAVFANHCGNSSKRPHLQLCHIGATSNQGSPAVCNAIKHEFVKEASYCDVIFILPN